MSRRRISVWTLATAATLFLAAACGGKSESDPGGSGGSPGGGGSGATSGAGNVSGGGSGGGTSACVSGGACSQAGAICTPKDECCPCSYICQGGSWQPGECPACEAPACPSEAPSQGSACGPCDKLLQNPCSYANGCVTATCDGKSWSVLVTPCPIKLPCGQGEAPCPDGTLCVYPGGLGDSPYCVPNPCGNQPVSCACAGGLCTYGYCAKASWESVYCECPNC